MKTFLVYVTTQYDGYEWLSKALVQAQNEASALRKAEKNNFTHENGIEVQKIEFAIEIPKNEVKILNKYFGTIIN